MNIVIGLNNGMYNCNNLQSSDLNIGYQLTKRLSTWHALMN